jgi:hypothetical protein
MVGVGEGEMVGVGEGEMVGVGEGLGGIVGSFRAWNDFELICELELNGNRHRISAVNSRA